jgi:DNA polymerase (family 10)
MNNQQVAEILNKIADLMDIKGEIFFKTRAYRMAAQQIEVLEDSIEQLVAEKRLEDIQGIGAAIANKIEEYTTTGHLTFYDKLTNEVPESLLDLLDISGLGPRKVAILFQKLGITTITELRNACTQGKLRNLEGFGEITERNILRGISLKEKTSGRSLLHIAYTDSTAYVTYLQTCPEIENMSIAGSLRRRKETIGDIDILVASKKPDKVMDHFVKYNRVDRILLQGSTKTSILLDDNLQVDLRVIEPKSYGAALQYFTGSKEHNVQMRSIAIKQGYKLNEYGLFDKNTNNYIAGKNEEEIYHHLGLQYIPPELRENSGEIELAQQKKIPTLVDLNDINGDLHVHSNYSDGNETITALADFAHKLGYHYIGITDHSQSLIIANGLTEDKIEKKLQEIQKINKKYDDFHILCGTECDIKTDGTLDYQKNILKKFDFVYIGIHTALQQNEKEMTQRITKGLQHDYVDFLAHPTGRIIRRRNPFALDLEQIITTAQERNIALEINAFPDRLDLNDKNIKLAKELKAQFVISTDSHNQTHLPFMQFGVATARRGGCSKKDIINTQSLNQLKQTLGAKR